MQADTVDRRRAFDRAPRRAGRRRRSPAARCCRTAPRRPTGPARRPGADTPADPARCRRCRLPRDLRPVRGFRPVSCVPFGDGRARDRHRAAGGDRRAEVERARADAGVDLDDDCRGGAAGGGLESGIAGRAAGQCRLGRDRRERQQRRPRLRRPRGWTSAGRPAWCRCRR